MCSDQQKVVNPGEAPTVVPLKIEKEYCSFQDALKHDFGTGKKLRKKLWKKREILWSVLSEPRPLFFPRPLGDPSVNASKLMD